MRRRSTAKRNDNKRAAARCHVRELENRVIEERYRNLCALNSVLKKQAQSLRSELTVLPTYALNHQDCKCSIAFYGANQAKGHAPSIVVIVFANLGS